MEAATAAGGWAAAARAVAAAAAAAAARPRISQLDNLARSSSQDDNCYYIEHIRIHTTQRELSRNSKFGSNIGGNILQVDTLPPRSWSTISGIQR